jgi:hypothetical protein
VSGDVRERERERKKRGEAQRDRHRHKAEYRVANGGVSGEWEKTDRQTDTEKTAALPTYKPTDA